MDYLYGQNATLLNNPPAVNGVPVTLLAVGSDNSLIEIGTATSDSSGTFTFKWTTSESRRIQDNRLVRRKRILLQLMGRNRISS